MKIYSTIILMGIISVNAFYIDFIKLKNRRTAQEARVVFFLRRRD
jgi:hypothetical protein